MSKPKPRVLKPKKARSRKRHKRTVKFQIVKKAAPNGPPFSFNQSAGEDSYHRAGRVFGMPLQQVAPQFLDSSAFDLPDAFF